MKREFGKVYLVEAQGTGRYKIGYTTSSIATRIAQLQTGCPDRIVETASHVTSIPSMLEMAMHNVLRNKCVGGEWFELTAEDVAGFKALCEKMETNIKLVMENNTYYQDKRNKRF